MSSDKKKAGGHAPAGHGGSSHGGGDSHSAPAKKSNSSPKVALFLIVTVLLLGLFFWPEIINRTSLGSPARRADAERAVEDAKFVQIRKITASVVSGQTPLPVTFTAEVGIMPDASPVQCLWSFGDGSPLYSGQVRVAYTYTTTGRFQVRLTVIDAKGRQAVSEPVVIVTTGPVEVQVARVERLAEVKPRRESTSLGADAMGVLHRGGAAVVNTLDRVLPVNRDFFIKKEVTKIVRPPEGTRVVTRSRPWSAVQEFGRPMWNGEWSPWFEPGESGTYQFDVPGNGTGDDGTQVFVPWIPPGEDPRTFQPIIYRFYNKDMRKPSELKVHLKIIS